MALVGRDVSKERISSDIRVTGIGETWVLTKGTGRNIPEDGILHSHHRENLKFYITLTVWTL
jgi:hypothetical protein